MQNIEFNVQHLGPSGLSAFEEWKIRTNQPSATWADYMEANKGENGLSAFEQWKIETSQPNATWNDYMEANKGIDGQDGADGDNAISWNFKGSVTTYAGLANITGQVANDAYLVTTPDEEGVKYLYIWNGISFPNEGDGLPYGGATDLDIDDYFSVQTEEQTISSQIGIETASNTIYTSGWKTFILPISKVWNNVKTFSYSVRFPTATLNTDILIKERLFISDSNPSNVDSLQVLSETTETIQVVDNTTYITRTITVTEPNANTGNQILCLYISAQNDPQVLAITDSIAVTNGTYLPRKRYNASYNGNATTAITGGANASNLIKANITEEVSWLQPTNIQNSKLQKALGIENILPNFQKEKSEQIFIDKQGNINNSITNVSGSAVTGYMVVLPTLKDIVIKSITQYLYLRVDTTKTVNYNVFTINTTDELYALPVVKRSIATGTLSVDSKTAVYGRTPMIITLPANTKVESTEKLVVMFSTDVNGVGIFLKTDGALQNMTTWHRMYYTATTSNTSITTGWTRETNNLAFPVHEITYSDERFGLDSFSKMQVIAETKPKIDNVDVVIPNTVYATVGRVKSIFLQNLHNAINISSKRFTILSAHTIQDEVFAYQPTTAGSGYIVIDESSSELVEYIGKKKVFKVVISARNTGSGTKYVLCLGDSLTAQNNPQVELNTLIQEDKTATGSGADVVFVGSKGTAPLQHEGNSGWSVSNYIASNSANPFYDGANTRLSLQKYCTTNGINMPDITSILLGTNDMGQGYTLEPTTSYATIIANMNTLINMLRDSTYGNPNMKIIINLVPYAGFGASKQYFRYKALKLNKLIIDEFEGKAGIVTNDTNLAIDMKDGYPSTNVVIGNTTYKKYDDVHYNANGARQVALQIYHAIRYALSL